MTGPDAEGPLLLPAVLRRCPVTLGLFLLLVATAALAPLSPSLLAAVGAGVGRPPWTPAASALWCTGPVHYLAACLAIVLLLGPAEVRLGSRTTLLGLAAGQVLGTAAGLTVILALSTTGDVWAREIAATPVVGPLPGVLAVAGLASARAPALWRRRVRLSVSIALVALVLYSGTADDVVRLSGWVVGLGAGLLVWHRGEAGPAHPSRREGRALVALVVAVTALGPLLAAVSSTPDGPWAVVSHLFVSTRPPHGVLRAVCGPGGDPAYCQVLQARARLTGHGPALLAVLPVVLQLVLAEGLRRGRHAAWTAAVVLSTLLASVGGAIVITVLRTPADALPLLAARPGSLPAVSVAAPLVAPLAVLVLLLVTRDRFGVHAAPGAVRRWWLTAGLSLALLATGYVVIGYGSGHDWAARTPSPMTLLADLPLRMLPPGYLGELPMPLLPRHGSTRVLADWIGVAAWTVLLVTAVRLIRPGAPTGDAARARALVRRHGDGALSFMTTWVGNRYWFAPAASAVVAYRVVGGVALTTGNPVGSPEARTSAVRGFTAWCEEHGWTPCWYSVTDDVALALADTGAQRLQVAAETWLPLGSLSFTGRRWQDVRTAVSRAAREGTEARWITWSQAPLALREQVARLSEEWLADKGLPEMGFTLGGLDELADDAVRCLLALDREGRVTGLTSWLPAFRDGVPVGWTLDVMRRSRTAIPGVMEFLIATAALTFQAEGAAWVSLSGAPLALPPGAAGRGTLNRLLELAGRTMEPVYGFRSLLAFKAKFQPCYRPLWLVYPSPADLPRIARAVSGAYLPGVSPGQALRLARALVHGHRCAPAAAPRRAPAAHG